MTQDGSMMGMGGSVSIVLMAVVWLLVVVVLVLGAAALIKYLRSPGGSAGRGQRHNGGGSTRPT